ncbi:MAG: hypothetical protein JWN44_3582 [Myxococcales bacterium]|nr:hypothetical protein [Myxococcales bacterium]
MRTLRVAFLLSILFSLVACDQLFSKPRVSVRRVDVTSLTFQGIGANLVFAVENRNAIGIDLAKLVYQLTVDNHPFVQGVANNPLHVPANGTGELALPVSFKFVELAQALASIFTKREVPFTINTKLGFGTPLGILEVPLSHTGTLPVPQLPTLSIGGANLGSINATGAGLSVTINVRNNNAFVLPLGPLSYGLAINGAPILNASTAPSQLAAGGTLPLTISAQLDFFRVGSGILRAVQSGGATLALDGSFDLGGYAMPVHLQTSLRR